MAKWDIRKHLLEVEAGRHLMGEADLLCAKWAEMERKVAWGVGGGTALGKVSMRKGVESEKDQGCLGAVRRNAGIGPMDIM